MEQDEKDFPWPRKGDNLWGFNDDLQSNACLNWHWDPFDPYSRGYRKAADILATYVVKNHRDQDMLVYPILFLYRHYIELKLKEITHYGSMLLEGSKGIPQGHDLNELWLEARKVLERIEPEVPIEDLDNFESGLNQLVKMDRFSTAFRYPEDKKGKPSLPQVYHINIRNVQEVMARLCSFLDACTSHIDHLRDCQAELYEHGLLDP